MFIGMRNRAWRTISDEMGFGGSSGSGSFAERLFMFDSAEFHNLLV